MLVYLYVITDDDEKRQFEKLYLAYHGEMMKYALSLCHNKYDAEDLVHDSFMYVAKNIHKFNPPSCHNPYGLIVIIVRNLYRNKLKRDKLISFEPYEEWAAADGGDLPDDITASKETHIELIEMIEKLGSDYSW